MKLSIITINYNNAAGLRKTIESVASQTYADFEYIIVDGAAPQPPQGGAESDTEVLQSFIKDINATANGFTNCTWKSANGEIAGGFYSEPDSGIYNAMNKGIRMAKGEYIHFLNSGDWLVDEYVVEKMLGELNELIDKGIQPDVFVGNKIMIRPDGKIRRGYNYKRPVTAFTFYRGTIEHTSAYIRRTLFDTVGLYDETLRIVSDWKWYFEAVLHHNAKVSFTDLYVTYFDNTIITINPACLTDISRAGWYNNASGLQKTMESVLAQTSKDFEYIIIDGASTDGSVQTIQLPISFGINNSTVQQFNN